MLKKYLKNEIFVFMSLFYIFSSSFIAVAADINSILSLLREPIAGFSLPENIISQANSYLLSHPNVDYDKLEAQIVNARGIVQSSIQGKEIHSLRDIVNCVSKEQKSAIIANLKNAAAETNLVVSLDDNMDDGKEEVVIVDKETGTPVFTQKSMIKETGRYPNISLKNLTFSLFCVISLIEVVFIIYVKNIRKVNY